MSAEMIHITLGTVPVPSTCSPTVSLSPGNTVPTVQGSGLRPREARGPAWGCLGSQGPSGLWPVPSPVGTWGWVLSSSAQHRAGHTAGGGNIWPRGAVQPNPRVRRCLWPGLSSTQPPRAPTPGNPCLVPSPEVEPVAQTSADQGAPGSGEDA